MVVSSGIEELERFFWEAYFAFANKEDRNRHAGHFHFFAESDFSFLPSPLSCHQGQQSGDDDNNGGGGFFCCDVMAQTFPEKSFRFIASRKNRRGEVRRGQEKRN